MTTITVNLISSMDRALHPVITKVRVWFLAKLKIFFRFLFNHLGCSFYCKDHFYFHIFICGSKYDSFHMIQFTTVTSHQNYSFVRSTHGPINNCNHLSKTKFVVNVQQRKQKWSWVLTVCPCFTVSLIKSSSKLARNVSLGCSMRGTTNSKIRATLWITR